MHQGQELEIRAKFIGSTSAKFIMNGVRAGGVWLPEDFVVLNAAAAEACLVVLSSLPDSLEGNKLVMAQLAFKLLLVIVFEHHCGIHKLM